MSSTTYNRGGSPTLWSTYKDLKAVLDARSVEKRVVQVIYDDSKRVVNISEVCRNLYIGDEYETSIIFR